MKVKTNSLIEGFSGSNGNVVFRTMKNGEIIMGNKPRAYEPTEHQRKRGNLLKLAHLKAADILENDEARRAIYEQYAKTRGTHVRQAIVIDILSKPKIVNVSWKNYKGLVAGSMLVVEAIDDHRVEEVNITINDAGGKVLENAKAQYDKYGFGYIYILKTATLPADSELLVSVGDYAGNVTKKAYTLSDIAVT